MYFRSPLEGWIGYDTFSSTLLHTEDGGVTWTEQELSAGPIWRVMRFTTLTEGYLAGGSSGSGVVYRTTDGGMTWEPFHNTTQQIFDMYTRHVEDVTHIWIVGQGGLIEYNLLGLSPTDDFTAPLPLPVHPNPAQSTVHLTLPSSLHATATLTVYNAAGQLIRQQKVSPTLDIGHWPSGTYRILIQDGANVYSSMVSKL